MKKEDLLKNMPIDKKIVNITPEGVYLIFLNNSGIIYWNQVGGHICAQRYEEGILIPFNNDMVEKENKLETQLSVLTYDCSSLNKKIANEIDEILGRNYHTRCAMVDRSRLNDSMEAWIYVIIRENDFCDFYNFKEGRGVLTWLNSD